MHFKDLTAVIAESHNLPVGTVRKVGRAFFERMAEAIDNGEKLQLPGLGFNPRTIPASDAYGDTPAKPERKVAILRSKGPKSDNPTSD